MKNELSNEHVEKILRRARNDEQFRIALATENHFWFFMFYFPHYLKYSPANFHRELFKLSELDGTDLLVATAFRGSGKSSVMSLSLPIWAVVGKLQKKFVVLSSQTQPQVKQIYDNIKEELESNQLLIKDFGPFIAKPWNDRTLRVLNYDAQILPVSLGSEIRGLRKQADRPDLVILDDVDSVTSTRTRERRDKTIEWFDRDIRQLGDINTNFVIIGNLLHEECLVSVLKKKILDKEIPGVYREYPLLDENNKCIWPDKYPTWDTVEKLRKSVIYETTWDREYLLRIFNDKTRIINYKDFDYYDSLPTAGSGAEHTMTLIAIDPAVGESEDSAFTAIVSGEVYRIGGKYYLFVNPYFINERLKVPQMLSRLKEMYSSLNISGIPAIVLVENITFQKLLVDPIQNLGFNEVLGVSPNGKDKKTRLEFVSPHIVNHVVKLPRNKCKEIVTQVVNIDYEKYLDLADAFVYLVKGFTDLSVKYSSNPVAVNVNWTTSIDLFLHKDWADTEDERMFRRLGRNRTRTSS